MAGRILVIRGGAIGDFILTLPAIGLLRENFPQAHLEIIGYRHIVALAEGRHYAHGSRSIDYAGMSRLFVPGARLEDNLREYLAGFNQVVSYIYDPDGLFEQGLRAAGVKNIIHGPAKLDDTAHATSQLARPLERLALYLEDPAPRLYPTAEDLRFASEFAQGKEFIAIHPGSGSELKNWPLERWVEVAQRLTGELAGRLLLIGGEADEAQLAQMEKLFPEARLARNLPLPHLAALMTRVRLFVGHDSGISHLAAATGAPCVLLFGPTDPDIWAPRNPAVWILRAAGGDLLAITGDEVIEAARSVLRSGV